MNLSQNLASVEKTVALLQANFDGQRLSDLTPHEQNTLALCSMALNMKNDLLLVQQEAKVFQSVMDKLIRGLTNRGDY